MGDKCHLLEVAWKQKAMAIYSILDIIPANTGIDAAPDGTTEHRPKFDNTTAPIVKTLPEGLFLESSECLDSHYSVRLCIICLSAAAAFVCWSRLLCAEDVEKSLLEKQAAFAAALSAIHSKKTKI